MSAQLLCHHLSPKDDGCFPTGVSPKTGRNHIQNQEWLKFAVLWGVFNAVLCRSGGLSLQPWAGAGARSRMRSAPAPWPCRSASTATRSPGRPRRPARLGAAPGAPPMCPTLPGASSPRTVPMATPAVGTPSRRTEAGGECVRPLGRCMALPHGHCCPRLSPADPTQVWHGG